MKEPFDGLKYNSAVQERGRWDMALAPDTVNTEKDNTLELIRYITLLMGEISEYLNELEDKLDGV